MDKVTEMDVDLLIDEYAAAVGELSVRDFRGDSPWGVEVKEWAARESELKAELKRRAK